MAKTINLKFPLRKFDRGFFMANDTTLDAVKEDIKVLLLTMKGERVINVDLGTNIPVFDGILFEQIDRTEMKVIVRNEITSALEKWMPNVILSDIAVLTRDEDASLSYSQVRVRMEYKLKNAESATDSVQFTIG